jgi:predicted ATPase/class 3 adenylate cyclase
MHPLAAYIPIDRRLALAAATDLPDRTAGAALFADISGFTRLTKLFVDVLGRKRGAEEVLPILNQIYTALIAEVHARRGAVIGFSGDAVTCWFDGDNGARAVAAGLAMQRAMEQFATVIAPGEIAVALTVKIAISAGPARRFAVGAPEHCRLDVLAGQTITLMAQAERTALSGEVVATDRVAENLGAHLAATETRGFEGGRVFVVKSLARQVPLTPWDPPADIPEETARQWVLPAVARRLRAGQGHFLAELRPASVVFVRFEGLDFDSDPDAGSKLDAYIRWVQGVAAQYDGALIQLTFGDKGSYYYIAFGAPVSHADDSLRAVATALVLRSPPASLAFIRAVQIGVAGGIMRTGSYGSPARLTYGVLGEKTNLAARLMAVAPPGEIFCDAAIYAAARNQWEFEIAALQTDPAKPTAPLGAIYRPTGEMITHHRLPAPSNSLVGRAAVMARLTAALNAALDGGTTLVRLEGEAGMGKSRLVAEAAAAAGAAGIRVLLGAGMSIEQQTPYRVWREILGQLLGWEDNPPAGALGARAASLAAGTAPHLLPRLPLLNDILPLALPENNLTANLPAVLRQENVMQVMTDLLCAVCQTQPLLIVFEDAHWMDALSWELSLRLARVLRDNRLGAAVFWVTRPPGARAAPRLYFAELSSLPGVEVILLEQLSAEEIRQLVRFTLNDHVPQIETLVLERAQGNPFFARELIFTLQEQGLIGYLGEAMTPKWSLAPDFSSAATALPGTLQGLILARIDRLPPEAQLALKVGAVIGRRFTADALDFVLGARTEMGAGGLAGHLQTLARQELVDADETAAPPAYLFRHVLTRDVAYETLLYAQRRELHLAVADWYEAAFAGEALAQWYPVLVHHTHAGEEWAREYKYLRLAAAQAQGLFANQDALGYLGRALKLAKTEEDLYGIHLQREEVLGWIGERAAQAAELDSLSRLAQALADPGRQSETAMRFAEYRNLMGEYEAAMRHAEDVVRLAAAAGDDVRVALGERIRGQVSLRRGEYEAARQYLAAAFDTFRRLGSQAHIADVYGDFGVINVYTGNFRRAAEDFEQALALYAGLNNRRDAARVQSNLAGAYGFLGDIPKTIAGYREALALNREIGEKRLAHVALGNLGIAYQKWGDFGNAEQCLLQALETSREIGDRRKEGTWLGSLGETYRAIGRFEQAVGYFRQALDLSQEIGNQNGVGTWQIELGETAWRVGDLPAARDWLGQALATNLTIGNRHGVQNTRLRLAAVALDEGAWEEAVSQYEAFRAARLEGGEEEFNWTALAGMAQARWNQNQVSEAVRYLELLWERIEAGEPEGEEAHLAELYAASEIFAALDDPRGAALLAEAHRRLREREGRIADADVRAEVLNAYREHRAILKAFAAG